MTYIKLHDFMYANRYTQMHKTHKNYAFIYIWIGTSALDELFYTGIKVLLS